MQILNQLLGKKSLSDFLEKHFNKLPYSSPDSGLGLCHLLNWDVVESIFAEKKSVLRIVKDGVYFKDNADHTFEEAKNLFTAGNTLLVRYAEKSNPALLEVAKEFETFFRNKVDIQLYCSPGGFNAFGWHYDVEEVFILQTKGSKEYTIRHNTIHPNPLVNSIPKDLRFESEKSDLTMKITLKEGDFLYIPSGWWHKAETLDESMHISIGVMPSSAVRITEALPSFLAQSPFWRTRMPVHQDFSSEDEAIAFYQDAFQKLGKDLLEKFSSEAFIQHYLNHVSHL